MPRYGDQIRSIRRDDAQEEGETSLASSKRTRGPIIAYTPELAKEICERIASGETLTAVCKDEHMPSYRSVIRWVQEDREGFKKQYNDSRELFMERMADEMLDISDNTTQDYKTIIRHGKEVTVPDFEIVNRSKLRVETRRWLLSKLKPKEFGDNIETDDKRQQLAADILDIIKTVANVARQPVRAEIIDVTPSLVEKT